MKNHIEKERYHKKKIRTEITEKRQQTESIRHVTEKLKKQGKEFEK